MSLTRKIAEILKGMADAVDAIAGRTPRPVPQPVPVRSDD